MSNTHGQIPTGDLAQGLIGYYSLDGNAEDTSGNNNNGVATSVTYNTNRFGAADASGNFSQPQGLVQSYITIPNFRTLENYPVTFSLWFNLNSLVSGSDGSIMTLIGKEAATARNEGAVALTTGGPSGSYMNKIGYIGYSTRFTPTPPELENAITTFTPATNQWYHLVFTYDNNQVATFYLDNVAVWQQVYSNFPSNIMDFRIGSSSSPVYDINARRPSWNGLIDDVAVYNRALSAAEVAALHYAQTPTLDPDSDGVNNYREIADGTDPNDPNSFNPLSKGLVAYYPFNGDANDESGYERDGTISNAIPANGRTCKTNESLYFNGVSYVAIPDPVGTNSTGSIALWFKADSWLPAVGGPGYPQGPWLVAASGTTALTAGTKVGDGDYFNLGAHAGDVGSSNLIFGNFHHWSGWRWANSGQVPPVEIWNSVVATWSDSQLTIFINGEKKGEISTGGLLDFGQSFHPDGLKWNIGASSWPGTGFIGAIDDVRFYDRTLTESDVRQLYYCEAFSKSQRDFLASNPSVQGHYSKAEYDSFGALQFSNGQASVKTNLSALNLFTQEQYNANRSNGQTDVTSNPSAFNLFTQTQFEANYNSGLLTGRAQVTNAPASFGLLSSNSVPSLRFTAGRAVSFSLSMPGQWTRYTQSEPLPKGWSFNTNTGVLRGRIPLRGMSKAVITPSSPSNLGTPITIEFQPR